MPRSKHLAILCLLAVAGLAVGTGIVTFRFLRGPEDVGKQPDVCLAKPTHQASAPIVTASWREVLPAQTSPTTEASLDSEQLQEPHLPSAADLADSDTTTSTAVTPTTTPNDSSKLREEAWPDSAPSVPDDAKSLAADTGQSSSIVDPCMMTSDTAPTQNEPPGTAPATFEQRVTPKALADTAADSTSLVQQPTPSGDLPAGTGTSQPAAVSSSSSPSPHHARMSELAELVNHEVPLDDNVLPTDETLPVSKPDNLHVQLIPPKAGRVGDVVRYGINIANPGFTPIENLRIVAYFSAGLEPIGLYGWRAATVNGTVVFSPIEKLDPDYEFACQLDVKIASAGRQVVRLEIRSDLPRGKLSIDRAVTFPLTESFEQEAPCQITIATPESSRLNVNSTIAYEVFITNDSSKEARDLQVVGYFPRGIEPIGVRNTQATVSDGCIRLAPIDRLPAGERTSFQILARAETPGLHRFRVDLKTAKGQENRSVERVCHFVQNSPSVDSYPSTKTPREQNLTPQIDAAKPSMLPAVAPRQVAPLPVAPLPVVPISTATNEFMVPSTGLINTPQELQGIVARTRASIEQGKLDSAKQTIEAGLEQFSTSQELYYLLGQVLFRQRNFDQAAWALGESLALEERNPHTHLLLAQCLKHLGEAETARSHMNRAKMLAK